jgi:hypothetical protein
MKHSEAFLYKILLEKRLQIKFMHYLLFHTHVYTLVSYQILEPYQLYHNKHLNPNFSWDSASLRPRAPGVTGS